MEGWIKIHRKIEDWQWASNPIMLYFWVKLLLMVNTEDGEWEGNPVERGSIVTSISKLAAIMCITPKQVRTCIEKFRKGKQVVTERANTWTKITVCNYEDYVGCENRAGQTKGKVLGKPRANQETPLSPPITPTILKETPSLYKETLSKDRGKKEVSLPQNSAEKTIPPPPSLESRQRKFYDSLIPFVSQYGKETIRDFYNYWSEPDRAAKPKMRFEKEKTWSLERRLGTWKRNEARFSPREFKTKGERMWDTVKKNLAVLPFNEDGTVNI